ncbi:CaiB/BaiF CoA transferase family protein [Xanthobacter tagetidis]|uniref:CoA transferase n=1 Tax=Xanthobacter tagetidis TaxID=60216 RepID=A0A3L7AB42_9HYPH|nr:CoA transferase [Xanthobacter tagetidis]MBB6306048.1 crotonobetainyl-CoA:carnitine CoA-transferase CaiB-like acyl-CoA transferase [Xanthobacter tagetidis]RLP77609.1 CoA transferase [Xanthobacter tagetidis]
MNAPAANPPDTPQARGPLGHLRVLDLTQFLSGPYATQILGDLGAEVIKVEAPEGDMTRRLPPYFVGEDSAYYLSVNRNKKSLAVDLKSEAGRALVRDLARACDVVVENFRPGVLDRLGLSYAQLSAEKPDLVWCSISGFGQDGPYRDRPAYDMIVQAMSGGMSLTGDEDGPSVRSGIPLGDIAAGMYGVIGILAALADRDRSGRGRAVDIAMLDCQIAMLSYQAAYFLASGHVPGRQGRGHDSIPTYRAFSCADGADVVITANTERMWQALCGVLGRPELADDPRFSVNARRYENRLALWEIVEAAFLTRPAVEWVEALVAAEIPAAAVNTLDRSLSDPHVRHRGMVLEAEGPGGEVLRVAGNPVKFVGEAEPPTQFPPRLGADEDYVLARMLQLPAERIAALRAAGVIGRRGTDVGQAGSHRTGAA